MDTYYGGAVHITMLKAEHARIGEEARDCERLLEDISATMDRGQECILDIALRFAAECAAADRRADEQPWGRFNAVVLASLLVTGRRYRLGQLR